MIIIALASNNCWNLAHFRRPLIRELIARGARVVAIAPGDGEENKLTAMGAEHIPIELSRSGTSPLADFILTCRYRAILRTLRPDALLGFTVKPNVYASLAARGLGIRVINNVSGLGTAFLASGALQRLVSALYRAALHRSATVFFQNPDDRDLFVANRLVDAGRTALLPGSGIDLQRFTVAPRNAEGPSTRFLFVGRMLRDKGLRELAEAARVLRSQGQLFSVALLGATDPANRSAIGDAELDSWVAAGLVERLGYADDVRPAVAAADCIVLPSYREGLPRSLIEAAAMGRPVIASDVPGCRHIVVNGQTGWLVPARDPVALAQAMRAMIDRSATERAAMGKRARALAEREFDERLVVKSYLHALGLVGSPEAPRSKGGSEERD